MFVAPCQCQAVALVMELAGQVTDAVLSSPMLPSRWLISV
jgi:hypothetical protein